MCLRLVHRSGSTGSSVSLASSALDFLRSPFERGAPHILSVLSSEYVLVRVSI